jgi:uncharacterized protein GlcG (DUF336 family)
MADMLKDGLKGARKEILWSSLLITIAVTWVWVKVGQAQPMGVDPAVQAVAGAQATSPAAKSKARRSVAAKRTSGKPQESAPPGPQAGRAPEIAGRRDPFKLPPAPGTGGGTAEEEEVILPCTGKRCLRISQLRLEGIVRLDTTNVMIAVVDTNANRAYFLRENDAVYNGVVSKITPDTVYFRENVKDPSGQVTVREVVKKLSQGPGEGR